MKPLLQFLRTTLVGGLLFLVPIIVLVVILGKALALAHKLVDPLAEHLPVHSVIGLRTPMLLAIAIIVLFCFLAGVLARTALAKKLVRKLETAVLADVPGYELLKGMGESMLGVEKQTGHQVVLARIEDAWQIAFGLQFGSGEFGNHAASLQGVAFLRMDSFHPAAVARSDPDLIGFNGAGDAGRARGIRNGTAGGQERQRHRRAQDKAELGLHAAGT